MHPKGEVIMGEGSPRWNSIRIIIGGMDEALEVVKQINIIRINVKVGKLNVRQTHKLHGGSDVNAMKCLCNRAGRGAKDAVKDMVKVI